MRLLVLLALSLTLISHGVERGRGIIARDGVEGGKSILSPEEDIEMERQLKILNKPSIKSIQTEHGDIYDCVDINKQPSLDHPMLRNHTIQMKPSFIPKGIIRAAPSEAKDLQNGLNSEGCPQGTVPIRRVRKEDLIRARIFKKRHGANMHPFSKSQPGYHFATPRTTGYHAYYGAQAHINVYNPSVSDDQFSEAVIWISNGPSDQLNCIQVGWTYLGQPGSLRRQ